MTDIGARELAGALKDSKLQQLYMADNVSSTNVKKVIEDAAKQTKLPTLGLFEDT